MITVDDAVNTLEFEDKFVIKPAFQWWQQNENGDNWVKEGKVVAENFQYSSDVNDVWIGKEEFQELLEKTGA